MSNSSAYFLCVRNFKSKKQIVDWKQQFWRLSCFVSISDLSFIARASYYLFPPLHYFRYIGHVGSVLRLFLLLGAGFGWIIF